MATFAKTSQADETLTYIQLGYMANDHEMYLVPEHPMYRFMNGKLTATTQIAQTASDQALEAAETANEALNTAQDMYNLIYAETDGLHVKGYYIDDDGQRISNRSEVLIDYSGMNVNLNGETYSQFKANYVQFGNYQLRKTADGGLVFKMRGTEV